MQGSSGQRVLLASHDTAGARAAEAVALRLASDGGALEHLIVVPELWAGMRGDDWLNNAAAQDRFGKYLEGELEREMVAHVRRLDTTARAGNVPYAARALQGDPARCLLTAATEWKPDIVVIGAPRPKGVRGLRSRMDLETLARGLATPLLIVPLPGPHSGR